MIFLYFLYFFASVIGPTEVFLAPDATSFSITVPEHTAIEHHSCNCVFALSSQKLSGTCAEKISPCSIYLFQKNENDTVNVLWPVRIFSEESASGRFSAISRATLLIVVGLLSLIIIGIIYIFISGSGKSETIALQKP